MVYSARPGRDGASDPIYRRSARPYYRVDVRDTGHLEFTDMVFWGGPLRARPVLARSVRNGPSRLPVRSSLRYFDQELTGKRSLLLSGTSLYPEVTVTRVTAAAR